MYIDQLVNSEFTKGVFWGEDDHSETKFQDA